MPTTILSLDAAGRLVEFWEKDNLFWVWKKPERAQKLADDEWEDVYSIILRAQKNELGRFWKQEEKESVLMRVQAGELRKAWLQDDDAAQILLGQREFWKPLRKPVEADWPPDRPVGIPLIDPEKIKRQDLPDPTAGKRALKFWDDRSGVLDGKRKSLKTTIETSTFSDMVTESLGPVPTAATSWVEYLRALVTDLFGTDAAKAVAAKAFIEQDLHLTVESFQRIVSVMENYVSAGAKPLRSKADWAEVFSLLTSAWKEKTLYTGWYDDEIDAITGVEPWRCVRHSLHKWRATAEERQRWDQALERKSRAPLIDPDMLASTAYLKTPGSGDAWSLWDQRQQAINVRFQSLRGQGGGTNRTATSLESITDVELGNGVLPELAEAKKAGKAIAARLQQINLSFDTLSELLRVRELLAATPPQQVLDSEWDSVCSILTQVWKQRQFADWQLEERAKGLSLSPDSFRPLPIDVTQFPLPPPPQLDPWRGSPNALLDWQDKLQSRIDQEQETITALANAVSDVEEQTLPALRDALLIAAYPPGLSSAPAGRWLGDHLGIATEYGGCHKTTRITQAIETFQIILWAVRTGTLADVYPDLKLVAPDFDEEWTWIGSYATWRAAMFVFLYPENILFPSLRRTQTFAFRQLVDELRAVTKITSKVANGYLLTYGDHLKTISELVVVASCYLDVAIESEQRRGLFIVARRGGSSDLYCDFRDPADSAWSSHSLWKGLGLAEGHAFLGMSPYKDTDGKQQLYVFTSVVDTEKKLYYRMYDVDTESWLGPPREIGVPKSITGVLDVVVMQTAISSAAPHLVIRHDTDITELIFEPSGTPGMWQRLDSANSLDEVGPMVALPSGGFYLFGRDAVQGRPCYRKFGTSQSQWQFFGDVGERIDVTGGGAFNWPGSNDVYVFVTKPNRSDSYRVISPASISLPISKPNDVARIVPASGESPTGQDAYFAAFRTQEWGSYIVRLVRASDQSWRASAFIRLTPKLPSGFNLSKVLLGSNVGTRLSTITQVYALNAGQPGPNFEYFKEAFYFLPVHIALQFQKSGAYIEALDWYRLVYDYTGGLYGSHQLVGLPPERATTIANYQRKLNTWLLDPLNPHCIAETREKAYTRYTLQSIIKCLLDYADSEFTKDTTESVARARELYEAVLELLDAPELRQNKGDCDQIIGDLSIAVNDPHWEWIGPEIKLKLKGISDVSELKEVVRELLPILAATTPAKKKYAALQPVFSKLTEANAEVVPVGRVVEDAYSKAPLLESAVLSKTEIATAMEVTLATRASTRPAGSASTLAGAPSRPLSTIAGIDIASIDSELPDQPDWREPVLVGFWKAMSVFGFCVPPNPVLRSLRMRADLNLYKIRNCRNIAGMQRQIEPLAAHTDTGSGIPVIGSGGQLVLPGIGQIEAAPYRYSVLIERAKQLVQYAVQVESAFLSALEKSDKEAFDLLSARASLRLAQAGIRLQDIRVVEARDGVKLAELQRDRSTIQAKTYEEWILKGMTSIELEMQDWANKFIIAEAVKTFIVTAIVSTASIIQAQIQSLSFKASFERRVQEWSLQKALADQDVRIGEHQIQLANVHVRIVDQEHVIEQMKADHAKEVLDFLTNKFGNKELYDWMSGILERVYSFFLQQATSMAQLAADQLAFERQETPPGYIQGDYWEVPSEESSSSSQGAKAPDRRGLTGSARLLQDIYQLDQYAFEKNQRKQQLTKIISLAQLDPLTFQRFRETGVLPFTTAMELFDRDFPGHYLRLIKRVRTTMVALIPPNQGIRATLTSSGISRVVIGGDLFQTTVVHRSPDTVALSAAFNATGLFEMQEQPEMLLPFEDQGVATSWELALPKAANPFDYSTIADVLITLEYTALNSFDYKQQVVQLLNAKRTTSADRAFSFRNEFADAWYDLSNPEQTAAPMSVGFQTSPEDFPPNVDNIRVENISLYIARRSGKNIEFESVDLSLEQPGGGSLGGVCRTENGLISTRSANGGGWLALRDCAPFGNWRLSLPNTEQTTLWFKDGDVTDIMFVITYGGRLPEWPL